MAGRKFQLLKFPDPNFAAKLAKFYPVHHVYPDKI